MRVYVNKKQKELSKHTKYRQERYERYREAALTGGQVKPRRENNPIHRKHPDEVRIAAIKAWRQWVVDYLALRTDSKPSRSKVAIHFGISPYTLSNWINGTKLPRKATFEPEYLAKLKEM